jgi:hypothetical protein
MIQTNTKIEPVFSADVNELHPFLGRVLVLVTLNIPKGVSKMNLMKI